MGDVGDQTRDFLHDFVGFFLLAVEFPHRYPRLPVTVVIVLSFLLPLEFLELVGQFLDFPLEEGVFLFQVEHKGFHLFEFGSDDVPVIYLLLVLSQRLSNLIHLYGCFLLEPCAVAAFLGLDVEVIMVADSAVTDPALLPVLLLQTSEVFGDFLHSPLNRAVHSIFVLFQLTFELNAPPASEFSLNAQLYFLHLITVLIRLQSLH